MILTDESGLLMAPLVRRTWAPRGHRPRMPQKGRHREKVSVAAALWVSRPTGRLRLSYRAIENGYFDNVAIAAFLEELLGQTRRPVVVLWDGATCTAGTRSAVCSAGPAGGRGWSGSRRTPRC